MSPPVRLFTPRQQEHAWSKNESAAFVGRGEVRSAHSHNFTARQIDARGDELLEKLGLMLEMVRDARSVADARNLSRVMLELVQQIKELDDSEDYHREANDQDVLRADDRFGEIIQFSEGQLRARNRELELVGVDVMEA